MIEEPKKLTVSSSFHRPTPQQVKALAKFSTGNVSDALGGASTLATSISFLGHSHDLPRKAVGPALTAQNRPADILGTLAAMKFIEAGDILVATVDGYTGCAAAGDLMMGMLKNTGAIGFITDGPVRDYQRIAEVGVPVWCKGLNPASPHTSGPAEVGLPINIGGQQVRTGDMIVADFDGVVIVPFERIDETIIRCEEIIAAEQSYEAEIAAGRTVSQKALSVLMTDEVEVLN
ncbi:RraA family protein [Aliiroseovarius sp. 2305UL8-7]|uniref:RraA family protein n=1 Tax=Aliiroseovarius conchicola TaxID=3121637 RepID=UPI0035271911